jgi:pimeloyl-ACP methyl ester carboxylesterase
LHSLNSNEKLPVGLSSLMWIVAGLLAADLLVHWGFAFVALRHFERKPPFHVAPVPPHPAAEHIRISIGPDLDLAGMILRPADQPALGVILFCPETDADRWSAWKYCCGLHERGFAIVSFDFRNQGDSGCMAGYEPLHWPTYFELADLQAVIDHVRRHPQLGELPLGLMGISRGGLVAAAGAALDPTIACVAAEGIYSIRSLSYEFSRRWLRMSLPQWLNRSIPAWHVRLTLRITHWLSARKHAARWLHIEKFLPRLSDRPLMLISGTADTFVEPKTTHALCRLAQHTPDDVWVVPGARHNGALVAAADEYHERLSAFFREGLNVLGNEPVDGASAKVGLPDAV